MTWYSTEDVAQEVHHRHGLPIGVARRLVEMEFRDLVETGVAVIRSHLAEGDRQRLLDHIAEAVREP